MHANLRHEGVLQTFFSDRDRTFNLNATPQQTRLSVHLVTRERTVATTNAEVHVHHQDVCAVDDAGCDLLFSSFERVEIGKRLDRDAGGDDPEENAVCYLQILLADQIPGVGRQRLCDDMDTWGYSFRLGSTRAWFEGDADDARIWLADFGVIDQTNRPTGALRC